MQYITARVSWAQAGKMWNNKKIGKSVKREKNHFNDSNNQQQTQFPSES